jgi:hypothetical protein
MTSRTFVLLGAALLFSSSVSVGRTQVTSAKAGRSESDSLGDAARKARAQKPHSGKPAKVFTNDDMGRLKDRPSASRNHSALAAGNKKPAGAVPSGVEGAPSTKN